MKHSLPPWRACQRKRLSGMFSIIALRFPRPLLLIHQFVISNFPSCTRTVWTSFRFFVVHYLPPFFFFMILLNFYSFLALFYSKALIFLCFLLILEFVLHSLSLLIGTDDQKTEVHEVRFIINCSISADLPGILRNSFPWGTPILHFQFTVAFHSPL